MTNKLRLAKTNGSNGIWADVKAILRSQACSLDGAKLYAEARRRTGLEQFGEPSIEPALTVLLESLENDANLRLLGRIIMRIHLRDLLETRLRLAAEFEKERHNLENEQLEKPIFIVGMPRSGSTFLQELLAEITECRAPRVWEVMFPVSAGLGGQRDRARRIHQAEVCLWWFRRLAPKADAVYPMRALTPHECVAIHSYTFLSEEFVSTCCTPSYEAFLRRTDLRPAYLWQKRFLQYLQLGSPARHWILKSPDHVYGLEALFSIFPDAQIIQTHRDPIEVLRSSADLTCVLRGLYGPPGDLEEIRAREASTLADTTERFMQFRNSHPEWADRFIDVRYVDLIANPTATVRRICEQTEIPFPRLTAAKVQSLASKRARYGGRRSSTETVSGHLGPMLHAERFARYCERFDLAPSRALRR